jgi:two-component system invasion response regulator UvrY
MINVLIADDHAILREGLKTILAETDDVRVYAEAASGAEVLEKVYASCCDVIVLDISMPKGNGLQTLRALREKGIKIPILILSMHEEDQYALRMIKAGANGYLTKESAPEKLIKAIRIVAGGQKYISKALVEKMAFALDETSEKLPHEKLAKREYEVMLLISQGDKTNEIAAKLGLSPKTVSTYKNRILEKMQLNNSAELTRYAVEKKLIE